MRIVYLSELRIPTKNAHGFQIVKMCDAFGRQGNEVELVVPWRRNLLREDPYEFYGVGQTFRIKKLPAIDLYPVRFVPERISAFLHLFSFLFSARIYLLFKNYDVLYTREIFAGLFFKDFVYEIHSHPSKTSGYYGRLLRRASKVVAITNYLRGIVESLGVPRMSVATEPDAVDASLVGTSIDKVEARKKLSLPLDVPLVVYTGNFRSWKGADVLADAAKILPEVHVVLVGGTKQYDVERLQESTRGYPNVTVLGYQPNAEMPLYTSAADILVMPNIAGEAISEKCTSPLKLFEYMASGRPIIASDLPSLREILNETNAIFFEPGNAEDLARKIKMLLVDSRRCSTLAAQALLDVRPYTWDKRAARIVDFVAS